MRNPIRFAPKILHPMCSRLEDFLKELDISILFNRNLPQLTIEEGGPAWHFFQYSALVDVPSITNCTYVLPLISCRDTTIMLPEPYDSFDNPYPILHIIKKRAEDRKPQPSLVDIEISLSIYGQIEKFRIRRERSFAKFQNPKT